MDPIQISVIIPVHNAGVHLNELLSALMDQKCPDPWEIVVVDNGSTDGSVERAMTPSAPVPIRAVDACAQRGAAYARNVGAREARGTKLLFIDADDLIEPGYVVAMAAALEEHPLVTSRADSRTLNPEWSYMAHGEWQVSTLPQAVSLPYAGIEVFTIGANLGIRRTLFEAVGGWPEEFRASEDVAFPWRAQLAGSGVHLVQDAVYVHRHRTTLREIFFQYVRWEMYTPLLYKQFRQYGMPRRTLSDLGKEWSGMFRDLIRARDKQGVATVVVRCGICLGRLAGSLRHSVYFP